MGVPARVIRKADRRAARRLRVVLNERLHDDPTAHNVMLYQQAERRLRQLRGEPEPAGEFGDCRGCGAGGSTPHWIGCNA